MSGMLGFAMPGGWEWLVVLIVALLIFGSRLPKMMRGLGSSVKEFRQGMDDPSEDATRGDHSESDTSSK